MIILFCEELHVFINLPNHQLRELTHDMYMYVLNQLCELDCQFSY